MMMALSAGMSAADIAPLGTMAAYAQGIEQTASPQASSGETDVAVQEEQTSEEETTEAVKVSTEEELTAALTAASTDAAHPTLIELQNDIELTKYIQINENTYVTIQSSGGAQYSLKATEASTKTSFFIKRNVSGVLYAEGNLILKNIILDANQKERCAYILNGASLELKEGAVLKNGNPQKTAGRKATVTSGGGVFVAGKLIMDKGSAIKDNTMTPNGASIDPFGVGVYLDSDATFVMNGGTISGNKYVSS